MTISLANSKRCVLAFALVSLLGLTLPALAFGQTTAKEFYDSGNAKQAKGDREGAIADWIRAIELDPKYSDAYVALGTAERSAFAFKGALADFNQAIKFDPNAKNYYCRGEIKYNMGNLDGAIADYTAAIELDPTFVRVYKDRGKAKQEKKDFDGAIADYSHAIKLDPDYYEAFFTRGTAKRDKQDLDGAIADFDEAIRVFPKFDDAYYERGMSYFEKREWTDAIPNFCKFCNHSTTDQDWPRICIWLSRTRLGETEAADKELAAYLDKHPGDPGLCSNVGRFLLDKSTEEDFLTTADDNVDKCQKCYFAGMKRLLAGDKSVAKDYFSKCIALDKKKDSTAYRFAKSELKSLGN